MKYTIVLSTDQLRVIDECLQIGQYRFVAPVIAEINRQIQQQTEHDAQVNGEDKTLINK